MKIMESKIYILFFVIVGFMHESILYTIETTICWYGYVLWRNEITTGKSNHINRRWSNLVSTSSAF